MITNLNLVLNVSRLVCIEISDSDIDNPQRTPMSADELANVRCPVLIVQVGIHRSLYVCHAENSHQAERSATHPIEHAQQLRNLLVNVPNGAQLFTVKGTYRIYLPEVHIARFYRHLGLQRHTDTSLCCPRQ